MNAFRILAIGVLVGLAMPRTVFSAEQLLLAPPQARTETASDKRALPAGHHATRFNPSALAVQKGQEFELTLPGGKHHRVVFDHKAMHANGDETWIGHVKGYSDHRIVITRGEVSVYGQLRTPTGKFELRMDGTNEVLVDHAATGMKPAQFDDAPLTPPTAAREIQFQKTREAVAATAVAAGASTIDVAVLYTPGMVSRLGSVSAVQTRINQLIALANQAYTDSNIAMNLRLVHTKEVAYPDNMDLPNSLRALSASENSSLSAYADPSLAGVKSLRDTYGADLVVMIRPYNRNAHQRVCGLAWLGGAGGSDISQDSAWGYTVIGDGTDIGGTGYYCDDYTLAHELGHNMGSAHDFANASGQGAYPYSYGHGSENIFGTIMAYIDPTVGKFSNPSVLCNGMACGIADRADNARSLNNTRTAIAAFRPAASSGLPLGQSGWWWNAAEPGRGYFIEMTGGRVFMGSFLYKDNGNPLWYVTSAAMNSAGSGSFSGNLEYYTGGQTLTGSYKSPKAPVTNGNITVTFSGAATGTLVWPGGSIPIQRFEIAPGSLSATPPSFQPETGWWWNANEGGRGFSIEIQGSYLYIAGFMYDSLGDTMWYVSGGQMTTNSYYQGTWQQCQGGQSMTGIFRPTNCRNLTDGTLSLSFTSKTSAWLMLPDRRQVQLTRYTLP